MTWITLLLCVAVLVGAITCSSERYHIVPVDSTALCQHYPDGTCFTLDQLSSQISNTRDTCITISFLPGEHLLTWNMTFISKTNITLNSEQLDNFNTAPRIRCIPNTRIKTIRTSMFYMQGLMLFNCQKKYNSRSHGEYDGGSAVYLKETTAIIKNCVFENNSAVCKYCSGGALYSENSTVVVHSCVFTNNIAFLGGGIFTFMATVIIKRSTFKNNTAVYGGALRNNGSETTHVADSIFEQNRAEVGGAVLILIGTMNITNSIFQYNRAESIGGAACAKSIYITASNFEHNIAGRDGGAVVITDTGEIASTVYRNNTAFNGDGGALFVRDNRMVDITNSTFEHNTALAGKGGAVVSRNGGKMLIINTTFSSNQAYKGGAIYLSGKGEIILITPLIISNNIAHYGGGIYLERSTQQLFDDDYIIITSNTAIRAGGGVYAFQSAIHLTDRGRIKIHNNTAQQDGGGIYLTASSLLSIDASGYFEIDCNTALQFGGGIYFHEKSQIIVYKSIPTARIILRQNAAKRGGAIYVSDIGSGQERCDRVTDVSEDSALKECFVQRLVTFDDVLVFHNNHAKEIGGDIYGGLLDRCITKYARNMSELGIDLMKDKVTFTWDLQIEDISQFYNHISSDPVTMCFCTNDIIDCNYTHPTVFKKKGETFTLNIVAMDQVGKPVNATLVSSLLSNDRRIEGLKEGQQFRPVGEHCTELEYNVYSEEKSAVLEIHADGPCGNQGISKQEVSIIFEPCTCPIGLEKTRDYIDCSCDCALEIKQYVSNCSPENETIQINENVWIKYINHTDSTIKYITHPCTVGYCVNKPVNISLANQTEVDRQCAFNRSGRLCGQCAQGLSLVFATIKCKQCSNYYLFLLLPFALAGIALVAFIMLLNITVATGTIHGLIFYANIIAANCSVFLPVKNNFLTVFISWLNLDLGIQTCFYNGMDSYSKFLLQLVFPAYVILLIAIILVLCNHSQRIAHLFGKKNPEATLYTLILLSYSKLIRLIITAIGKAHIDYPDGQKVFWLYDANVPYFTPSHIPRFLAAFIITILGAVYTTLLLFGQLFNRCSEHRLMKWTTHRYYIHFLKAHHAPFSDKHRYWVGLLLLARLVHYLITVFFEDSTTIMSVCSLTILLLLHKISNQIYKNWFLNTLETIFIANLNILAVVSFYLVVLNARSSIQEARGDQQALVTASISISFIAFLGMVLHHILDSCGVKLGKIPNTILIALRECRHDQPTVVMEEKRLDNYELFIQQDDDQLREPALDDLIPVRPEDYNTPPTPPPQYKEPTFTEIDITTM